MYQQAIAMMPMMVIFRLNVNAWSIMLDTSPTMLVIM